MTFQDYLKENFACSKARKWAAGKTAAQAWNDCERADWLIWWINQGDSAVGPDYSEEETKQVWFIMQSMVLMIPMKEDDAARYCKLLDMRLNGANSVPPADCDYLHFSRTTTAWDVQLEPNNPMQAVAIAIKSACLNYLLNILNQKHPKGSYVVGILTYFQSIGEVSDENKATLAQIVRARFAQPWKEEDSENV